jgi:hypothetical protein
VEGADFSSLLLLSTVLRDHPKVTGRGTVLTDPKVGVWTVEVSARVVMYGYSSCSCSWGACAIT